MKNKIALINPGKKKDFSISAPFNLGFLAAFLKKNNIQVEIIDELAGQNAEDLISKSNFSYIGITGTTPVIYDAYKLAEFIKKNTNSKIILGGIHSSAMAEEALKYADIVVKNEGENALLNIIQNNISQGIIEGDYIKNIDEIPSIPWDLIDIDFYLNSRIRLPNTHLSFAPENERVASLVTARGCVNSCIFCYNCWKKYPVRFNSVKRIIHEIDYFIENFKIKYFYFADDDFFMNKKRILDFCDFLIKNNYKLKWSCQSSVKSADIKILQKAKESGCVQIGFGFESGSDRILKLLKGDKFSIKENYDAISNCNKIGIDVLGCFIIGTPGETIEDIKKTAEFIIINKINQLGLFMATPFPGTKLFKLAKENNLLPENFNWNMINTYNTSLKINKTFSEIEYDNIFNDLVEAHRLKKYSPIKKTWSLTKLKLKEMFIYN